MGHAIPRDERTACATLCTLHPTIRISPCRRSPYESRARRRSAWSSRVRPPAQPPVVRRVQRQEYDDLARTCQGSGSTISRGRTLVRLMRINPRPHNSSFRRGVAVSLNMPQELFCGRRVRQFVLRVQAEPCQSRSPEQNLYTNRLSSSSGTFLHCLHIISESSTAHQSTSLDSKFLSGQFVGKLHALKCSNISPKQGSCPRTPSPERN